MVVGSASPTARRQVEEVKRSGIAHVLEVAPERPVGAEMCLPKHNKNCVLHLPLSAGAGTVGSSQALVRHLGSVALELFNEIRPGLLILCGGETAAATLAGLHVTSIEVLRELFAGVPLGRAKRLEGDFLVVLKAGNHGSDDILVEMINSHAKTTFDMDMECQGLQP